MTIGGHFTPRGKREFPWKIKAGGIVSIGGIDSLKDHRFQIAKGGESGEMGGENKCTVGMRKTCILGDCMKSAKVLSTKRFLKEAVIFKSRMVGGRGGGRRIIQE